MEPRPAVGQVRRQGGDGHDAAAGRASRPHRDAGGRGCAPKDKEPARPFQGRHGHCERCQHIVARKYVVIVIDRLSASQGWSLFLLLSSSPPAAIAAAPPPLPVGSLLLASWFMWVIGVWGGGGGGGSAEGEAFPDQLSRTSRHACVIIAPAVALQFLSHSQRSCGYLLALAGSLAGHCSTLTLAVLLCACHVPPSPRSRRRSQTRGETNRGCD